MTETTTNTNAGRGRGLTPHEQAVEMDRRLQEFAPAATHAILGRVRPYDETDLLRLPVLVGRPGEAPDLVWFSLGRTTRGAAEHGTALAAGFVHYPDVVETVVELSVLLRERLEAVQNPTSDPELIAAVRKWWSDRRPRRVSPSPLPGLH